MKVCIKLSKESELRDLVNQLSEVLFAKKIVSQLGQSFPNLEIDMIHSIDQVEFAIDPSFDKPTTVQIPIMLSGCRDPFLMISLMMVDKGFWEGDISFNMLNLADRVFIYKTKEEQFVGKLVKALRKTLRNAGRRLIDFSSSKS